jgi:Tfp pilus assembly protein PilF
VSATSVPKAPVSTSERQRAHALVAQGIQLAQADKLEEAEPLFREAVRLRPDWSDAQNSLGVALARRKQFAEALPCFRAALELGPESAELHNNLGNALRDLQRSAESLPHYERAIRLNPEYKEAYFNRGIALFKLKRYAEAAASYTQALERDPDHLECRMNRAFTWLHTGDWGRGWAEYEWRHKKHTLSQQPLVMPPWTGFPLQGRRILVLAEQGLGDTLQFIRLMPILKGRGAFVIFACPDKLTGLLARTPGVDLLISQRSPLPDHDCYAPLLSLPGLLGLEPRTVPRMAPYLHADPALVERWKSELSDYEGLKVGIHWQGNPKFPDDANRSFPLALFESLARVPGVTLFSLQKFDGIDQLAKLGGRFPIVDLAPRLDEKTGPFQDTAAVLHALDLLISCDSSITHLAGGMGTPAWTPLSAEPDWRWGDSGEASPWYPSVRLFRQETFRDWAPVFGRMAVELAALAERKRTATITVEVGAGELIDKITILEIKAERIDDPAKLANIHRELEHLRAASGALPRCPERDELTAELRAVNDAIWDVEEGVRDCERLGDFGERFIELARAVYQKNDRRAALKRKINLLAGSGIIEEKSHPEGSGDHEPACPTGA